MTAALALAARPAAAIDCDWCDLPAVARLNHDADRACAFHLGYWFGAEIAAGMHPDLTATVPPVVLHCSECTGAPYVPAPWSRAYTVAPFECSACGHGVAAADLDMDADEQLVLDAAGRLAYRTGPAFPVLVGDVVCGPNVVTKTSRSGYVSDPLWMHRPTVADPADAECSCTDPFCQV